MSERVIADHIHRFGVIFGGMDHDEISFRTCRCGHYPVVAPLVTRREAAPPPVSDTGLREADFDRRHRCDVIVNNGEGEPTECGRPLPCGYHAATPPKPDHPRTYSLTASGPNGELFLVTDDESGITIGHAKVIGGPLTAPRQVAPPASDTGLRAALEAVEELVSSYDHLGTGSYPRDVLEQMECDAESAWEIVKRAALAGPASDTGLRAARRRAGPTAIAAASEGEEET